MRIHFHHHIEVREEVMRRLDALDHKMTSLKETIMSTFEDLATALVAISAEVAKISADTDNLLAQLAAIPAAGLTAEQQAALDAAVAKATEIAAGLKSVDDKVPDVAPPSA